MSRKHSFQLKAIAGNGMPLSNPLDVGCYVADDFANQHGIPLPWKKQRKALKQRCKAAKVWRDEYAQQRANELAQPRKLGQRMPLASAAPVFMRNYHAPQPK